MSALTRTLLPVLIGAAFVVEFAIASSSHAATVYIDFGRTGAETTATGWNNVAAVIGGNQNGTTTINGQGTPGTPSVGLIDSTGAASGITLSLSFSAAVDTGAAGSAADYAGPYPAKVSAWPAAAVSDGFFSQINNGGSTMNMSFTGLDDNLAYDLMFYGARGTGTGLNQATYTVTGRDGASSRTTSVLNNSAQTPEFLGVSPNNGEILVAFTRGSGLSGTGALNAMSLTAVPEPISSVLAVLGVGGLGLFIRRRGVRRPLLRPRPGRSSAAETASSETTTGGS